MSGALGCASGVLLVTITFEMLPNALGLSSLPLAMGGFAAGFALVYAFDLFIHRGVLVGEKAEQHPQMMRRHRLRDGKVTVLAGGTSVEEVIEGLSIGVGFAVKPGLGPLIAFAIVIDNFSEALSIGEIIRRSAGRRILGWTGLIGASVLISSLVGWFFLRRLPQPVLGTLFGAGAGGMFYLTVTNMVPEAEEHQYQQFPRNRPGQRIHGHLCPRDVILNQTSARRSAHAENRWPATASATTVLATGVLLVHTLGLGSDDLAGHRDNKPEPPISITKGQAEAARVLTDTALARAVDNAGCISATNCTTGTLRPRATSVASTSTAPSVRRILVSISFAVSGMGALSLWLKVDTPGLLPLCDLEMSIAFTTAGLET